MITLDSPAKAVEQFVLEHRHHDTREIADLLYQEMELVYSPLEISAVLNTIDYEADLVREWDAAHGY